MVLISLLLHGLVSWYANAALPERSQSQGRKISKIGKLFYGLQILYIFSITEFNTVDLYT